MDKLPVLNKTEVLERIGGFLKDSCGIACNYTALLSAITVKALNKKIICSIEIRLIFQMDIKNKQGSGL